MKLKKITYSHCKFIALPEISDRMFEINFIYKHKKTIL